MAIVDPKKSGSGRRAGPGKKVLAAIGVDRGTSQAGLPKLDVHWIVVEDLSDEPEDKGASHWDTFSLADNALFRLGGCAKALGHTEPFDSDDNEAISQILTSGYCIGVLTEEAKFNGAPGEKSVKTKYFDPYNGPEGPEWADMIAKGEEDHAAFVERKKNGSAGSRRSSGSGGGGNAGGDSEIPF